MEILATPAFWLSLTALTFLEIVLGIDNLLFVSIAIGRLKGAQQRDARRFGVWGAMVLRIIMLAGIFWVIQLDQHPLFQLPTSWPDLLGMHGEHVEDFIAFTVKDLILLGGGLFLLMKGTQEIHSAVQGAHHEEAEAKNQFSDVLLQLAVINIVFSLDSVITAVGMVESRSGTSSRTRSRRRSRGRYHDRIRGVCHTRPPLRQIRRFSSESCARSCW